MAVNAAASPASTNDSTTAGPAYCAAAVPVVTKMPAPTTLAIPSGQAEGAHRRPVEPLPVLLGLDQNRLEPVRHARSLTDTHAEITISSNGAGREARLRHPGARRRGSPSRSACSPTRPGLRLRPDHTLAQVREQFDALEQVRVAGRVMLIRRHGRIVFANLKDQTGTVQIVFLDDKRVRDLDRGDWIGVEGTQAHRQGRAVDLGRRVAPADQVAAPAARQAPRPHRRGHAAAPALPRPDRQPGVARVFDIRSAVIASVRRTLAERGFTEVETPVLDASAGARRARSSPTTTRSTSTCTCASRSSSISSAWSSAASSASSRSAACSATRGSTPATTRSSRCSRPTRRWRTTTT